MIQIKGDLFNRHLFINNKLEYPDAICVTTNGFVKWNGRCVMGRGCAKELQYYLPDSDLDLGNKILSNGNIVQKILGYTFSFPVKDFSEICNEDKSNVVSHMKNQFNVGDTVPGWACIARLDIIERSAKQLVQLIDDKYPNFENITLPRPGCGAGELKWNEVKEVIKPILDDRFKIITW